MGKQQFDTGAQRDELTGKPALELISPFFLKEMGFVLGPGGVHYGVRNWEKGIPDSRYMGSLLRHIVAFQLGDKVEPRHLGKAAFNLQGLIHNREMFPAGNTYIHDLPDYEAQRAINGPIAQQLLGELGEMKATVQQCLDACEPTYAEEPAKGLKAALDHGPTPVPHRIYVAGPYSAQTTGGRMRNSERASAIGLALMKKGHLAHVPHTATQWWHSLLPYESFMALDLSLIGHWATALYFIGPSPGANRERAYAEKLGMPIFTSLDGVPQGPRKEQTKDGI